MRALNTVLVLPSMPSRLLWSGAAGRLLLLPVLLAVLLTAGVPVPAMATAVSVTDDAGRRVMLPRPARRIVSLAPAITELLFAAGAGAAVVGASEFSDYPAAARAIPRIGGGGGLDLEAIVALQPDLVIAWQSGNPAGQLQRLQALGLPLYLSEPRRLEDIPATLRRLGELAGTAEQAATAAQHFSQRLQALQQRFAGLEPVDVFYQIWDRPLMTLNGEHLFTDVLQLCGGRNVFNDLPALAPQVSIEAVLAADPDVILVAGTGTRAAAIDWRDWQHLRAVRDGQVHVIEGDTLVRHSPRILDAAADLCKLLQAVRLSR